MFRRIVVAVLLTTTGVLAQTAASRQDATPATAPTQSTAEDRLQAVLDAALEEGGGVGISAALLLPGRPDWIGASGMSDPADKTPITPDTMFCIASIAKTYVAAVILQLAEAGRLSLDAQAADLLPEHAAITNGATVRQLLSHTSGIFDFVEHQESIYRVPFDALDPNKVWTARTILPHLVEGPYSAPGQGWHYSTTNYVLLGQITERLTEMSLATAVGSRLLTPFDLENTVISLHEALRQQARIAHPWFDTDGDGVLDDLTSVPMTARTPWAEGVMYATAHDVARWGRHLYTGNVFGQALLDQALTFHRPTPGEDWLDGYGLGTATGDLGGVRWWGHAGWDYGFKCGMLFLPDIKASLVVLCNDNGRTVELAAFGLARAALELAGHF